jgi:hypothetical protein
MGQNGLNTFVIANAQSDANITFGNETTMINTHETGAVLTYAVNPPLNKQIGNAVWQ